MAAARGWEQSGKEAHLFLQIVRTLCGGGPAFDFAGFLVVVGVLLVAGEANCGGASDNSGCAGGGEGGRSWRSLACPPSVLDPVFFLPGIASLLPAARRK
jgi:hypothetical protein